jgi:hypothetical protein
MTQYLKVKGYDGLVRDPSTGVILNTNDEAYASYKRRKRINQTQKQTETKVRDLEGQISNLKNDIDDIKSMLKLLLERN